jgi:DNA-binding PadR family transcriptional regulator
MAPNPELMKGISQVLVMQALTGEARSGLEILDVISTRSESAVAIPQGTIYPLLYRLEKQGLLRAHWRPGDGSRRERVYELTDKGRRTLARSRRECLQLADAMRLLLGEAT